MDHEYRPDPRTGMCTVHHPDRAYGHGRCLWCGHAYPDHDGKVSPEVREHYTVRTAMRNGKIEVLSTVKWSTTACSISHCACKHYER